jgi:hypothetical protein
MYTALMPSFESVGLYLHFPIHVYGVVLNETQRELYLCTLVCVRLVFLISVQIYHQPFVI